MTVVVIVKTSNSDAKTLDKALFFFDHVYRCYPTINLTATSVVFAPYSDPTIIICFFFSTAILDL